MSEDVVAEDEGTRTRLLLLVAGGILAVLALILFVVLPLLNDEPDVTVEDDVDVVDLDPSDEPTPEPSEDFELAQPGAGGGDGAPPETFEVFSARDPFRQLVREDEAGNGGGQANPPPDEPGPGSTPPPAGPPPPAPTAPPGGPTVPGDPPTASPSPPPPSGGGNGTGGGTGTDGGTGGGTGTDGDDPPGGGGGGGDGSDDGSANVGGTTVTLVDVFTDDDGERKATVTVNGTGYTVGEGATFGGRFRLLDISGSCSTMLFGDSRFTLCEGDRIRK